MKQPDELQPQRFAPAYAALYPVLAEIARKHGYALAVHGSMQRDFDVVAIPWIETVSDPDTVVDEIVNRFSVRLIGEPQIRPHGRTTYTLSIAFGECAVDLSFMPHSTPTEGGPLIV